MEGGTAAVGAVAALGELLLAAICGAGAGGNSSAAERNKDISEKLQDKANEKWAENSGAGKESTKTGGAYKDVSANGGQVHHMPADSVSPFSKNSGPSIRMEPSDHLKTASWGNSKLAQQYRAIQKNLIAEGLFMQAQQMDIDDVRALFGNKYDEAIQQMLEYTIELLKDY